MVDVETCLEMSIPQLDASSRSSSIAPSLKGVVMPSTVGHIRLGTHDRELLFRPRSRTQQAVVGPGGKATLAIEPQITAQRICRPDVSYHQPESEAEDQRPRCRYSAPRYHGCARRAGA
jgi:hypothetical protein